MVLGIVGDRVRTQYFMLKRNLNRESIIQVNPPSHKEVRLEQQGLSDRLLQQRLIRFRLTEVLIISLKRNCLEGQTAVWALLGQCVRLRNLDLSHNNLKHAYLNNISSQIEAIDLSSNCLTELNLSHNLNKLKQLLANNNLLIRLDITYQNNSLRILSIGNNRLSVLGLGQLTELRELDASHNEIIVVNLCPLLEHVNLSHNSLKNVSFLPRLSRIQFLDLSHNQLKELDFRIIQPKSQIRCLDVSNNKIKEILGLEALSLMQTLTLSNNQLGLGVLEEVEKLQNLRQFECLGNNFHRSISENREAKIRLYAQQNLRTAKVLSPKRTAKSFRAQSSEKKKTQKYNCKDNPEPKALRAKSSSNRSGSQIKDSPFRLFTDESSIKPAVYTLGDTAQLEPGVQSPQDPEVKYFLQILHKYFMIPLKPILKREAKKVRIDLVVVGIEYNLMRDLYRNVGAKFSRLSKVTHLVELLGIENRLKDLKPPNNGNSLYFLHNEVSQEHLQAYLGDQASFQDLIKDGLPRIQLSLYPREGTRNLIVKTSYCAPPGKQSFEFEGSTSLFSLIYLVQ